ncbi:Uncharacterised protein [Chryseobacterium indologenes]|nr:Uncharacterised protein [Chryseobacterium indologenes]
MYFVIIYDFKNIFRHCTAMNEFKKKLSCPHFRGQDSMVKAVTEYAITVLYFYSFS